MIALLLTLLFAQTPETQKPETTATTETGKEHGLGEEVITGQVKIKIDDAKLYFTPRLDPFSPVNDLLVPETYVFDQALYRSVDSITIPHHFIHSSFLRVPVDKDLIYGDIIVFLPSFENRVATWELVVSNSLGKTVRRIVRKGQPPAAITWDGRTDNGDVITTGEIYSFTFNAYDAQGNQTRTPIMPQRINGMVYHKDNEWTVSIAADQLFTPGTAQLLQDAGHRLDEAANIAKQKFKKEIVVYVYTEQERLSTERCNIIQKELKNRMVLPGEALKVAPRFIPGLQPKFSKVEIHIL
ncbi:hypothetical protein CH330_09020 [candidate division WOR-3 bacterium JGI_Cruoil_03_51_56]|uniref:FlgD/Vpr Ig-like domain-containing protein n=1 Tax=candidate division WOR-3 bacterium JGI_Cruoil_03_51_56 TaxID=1973747 RepID=A0A235BQI4_UNCW3|nr:MAG: hypothetical protein CH330_09020 [candidate division WOR-3 bacterium JGI_Cruoil_03_51_56]